MAAAVTATMSFIASAAFAEPPSGKGKNKAKKAKERVEQIDRQSRNIENSRRKDADHRMDGEHRQNGAARSEDAKERSLENRRDGDRRQDADRRQNNDRNSDVENRRNENAWQDANRRNSDQGHNSDWRQDSDKRRDVENRNDGSFIDELRENREGVESKGKGKKKADLLVDVKVAPIRKIETSYFDQQYFSFNQKVHTPSLTEDRGGFSLG